MCHLHLTVERVSENLHSSLMYEVLVDQTMWAVCGRTTGTYFMAPLFYLSLHIHTNQSNGVNCCCVDSLKKCSFLFYNFCSGVMTLDENYKQTIQLDVMPLISGYLPVPLVRLSKYIPADQKPKGKGMT